MTEEQLMAEVKKGDLDKSSHLFDLYNARIYNFFLRMTFDQDLSHDLTQNVFLRMIKYRNSYNENRKFKSWIYQIARNVHHDQYQKNKMLFSDYKHVSDISAGENSVVEEIEEKEKYETLYQSMGMLDQEQRELLVMSRFQKMKYEEIAGVMNITVASVKVKVHRAIKKLRENYFELERI